MAVTSSGKDKLTTGMRLYLGGYDLSGDARTFGTLLNSHETADITGWSEGLINYLAAHRSVGVTGFQALMNDATGKAWGQLKTPGSNTGSQLSIGFGGGGSDPAVGDPAYHLPSIQFSANPAIDSNAVVFTSDFMPDAGQVDSGVNNPAGVVLRGPTALSATLTASSSNSVDNEAAATNGWSAIIQVLSTSSGNFAFTIEHSSDDSAFSTLGTFTTTGGSVGSELLTGTGTVNQYVAFNAARTAGTVTVVVTFVRN